MSGSIFKEVTFTPQSFDKEYIFENHRRFGKLIGILESLIDSGIIIGASNHWKKDVNHFLSLYDDSDKDELENLLETLSKRNRLSFSLSNQELTDEKSWIKAIEKLNKERSFDFAAGTITNKSIKNLEDIDRKAYINSGATIQKQTLSNIEKILKPVLSYAEIIKIFDPYFKIEEKRFFTVLELVCKKLGNGYQENEDYIIDIHTSIKSMINNKKEFDWEKANSWIQKIKSLEKQYKHQITIKIWEDTDKNKWHDRWIITDQCGITMGKGSDTGNWTDATWGLLDWEKLPEIEDKFVEGRNLYHFIGKVTSAGIEKNSMPKTVLVKLTDAEQKSENLRLREEAERSEKNRLEKLKNPKKLGRRLVPLSERNNNND